MRPLYEVEKDWSRKKMPRFDVGDTVDVQVKIIEGDRERIQIFSGTVIAKRHQGLSETFTVRRIVQGEGVERIFPVHSPRVVDVVVKMKGDVRRAKLHYLRERIGRGTRIEEKISAGREEAALQAAEAKAEKAEKAEKAQKAAAEKAAAAEKKPEPAAPAK